MSRLTLLVPVLVPILIFTGCTPLDNQSMPKPDQAILDSVETSFSERNNRLGLELFHELYNNDENIMISPVSIAMALHMAYSGAAAQTGEAMANVLHISDIELETLNNNNLALLYLLKSADPKVRLEIANSLWAREGFPFNSDFLRNTKEYYLAKVSEMDFNDPKAVQIINNWVSDNTRGLIKEIVDGPIDPLTVMFLVNAVYFQGTWTKQFSKDATRDADFHITSGNPVKVPMMSQSGSYDYLETPDFQAVRLPYGEEGRLAMYIFLPDENLGLDRFLQDFTWESWQNYLSRFDYMPGSISLPRFTLEYEKSLVNSLKSLGMDIAFDSSRADFSAMVQEGTRDDLYISDVKHKTFIKVDEEGTEAAAVTSVEVRITSAPLEEFRLTVDRPFFYAIHDRETGAILFMGTVQNPAP